MSETHNHWFAMKIYKMTQYLIFLDSYFSFLICYFILVRQVVALSGLEDREKQNEKPEEKHHL